MWVNVDEWMKVERESTTPVVGSLLRSVGVRVRGVVTAADAATADGLTEAKSPDSSKAHGILYAVTGTASEARDVWTGTKRWGQAEHSGAEFVLTTGVDRFQVASDGHASDVVTGSRLTVTGPLALVGEYEWDDFELVDTRTNLLVTEVVASSDGHTRVRLVRPDDEDPAEDSGPSWTMSW